jgi:hypothetical protein
LQKTAAAKTTQSLNGAGLDHLAAHLKMRLFQISGLTEELIALVSIGAAAGICHLIWREWQARQKEDELESREAKLIIFEEVLRRDLEDYDQNLAQLKADQKLNQELILNFMDNAERKFGEVQQRETNLRIREHELALREEWLYEQNVAAKAVPPVGQFRRYFSASPIVLSAPSQRGRSKGEIVRITQIVPPQFKRESFPEKHNYQLLLLLQAAGFGDQLPCKLSLSEL